MNARLAEILKSFEEVVARASTMSSIVRATELQRNACDEIEEFLFQLAEEKKEFVEQEDEESANILLGCQCVLGALREEISMWLLLKENRPDDAWDCLVRAQSSLADAMKTDYGFEHWSAHCDDLSDIERLVFPPQVFISSGMLVKRQECSICGQEYGDCDHLAGRPYMGEFCSIIARDFEFDHISIVKAPADKQCRVREFSAEGGMRNRMTWLVRRDGGTAEPDKVR